jgi:hypothetical protein
MHADFKGHKLVLVGGRLHFFRAGDDPSFADFLLRYFTGLRGEEWKRAQEALEPEDRHLMRQWLDHLNRMQRHESDGRTSVPRTEESPPSSSFRITSTSWANTLSSRTRLFEAIRQYDNVPADFPRSLNVIE